MDVESAIGMFFLHDIGIMYFPFFELAPHIVLIGILLRTNRYTEIERVALQADPIGGEPFQVPIITARSVQQFARQDFFAADGAFRFELGQFRFGLQRNPRGRLQVEVIRPVMIRLVISSHNACPVLFLFRHHNEILCQFHEGGLLFLSNVAVAGFRRYNAVMTQMLKIAITGANGRMGLALIKALAAHPTLELVAAGIRHGSAAMAAHQFEGAGVGFATELMVEDAGELLERADAVIDFTRPENTVELANLAAKQRKILVSGTTGLSPEQKQALIHAGETTRVVWSANMSVGVNVLMALVEQTAAKLGTETDIEIVEMHHRQKVDAPSGTALALGEAAARGRKVDLHDVWVKSRDGVTGAREAGSIGFATLRGGDVIGDHTVIFAGPGERIELSHKASTRDIFARGALVAADWVRHKPNGFYTMKDVVAV